MLALCLFSLPPPPPPPSLFLSFLYNPMRVVPFAWAFVMSVVGGGRGGGGFLA